MSPHTKFNNWHVETPSSSFFSTNDRTKKRKGSQDDDWTSIASSESSHKKQKIYSSEDTNDSTFLDLEGSTLVPNSSPSLNPAKGIELAKRFQSRASDVNASDDTIVVDSAAYHTPTPRNIAADHSRRKKEVHKLSQKGWPKTDIALFQKLAERGHEPLLPSHWEKDFEALPSELFTADTEKAFIKALGKTFKRTGAEFRGRKALEALLELGPKVRDRVTSHKAPEATIRRAIEAYVKWSLADVGIAQRKGWNPNLAIEIGKSDEESSVILANMQDKLKKLHNQWEQILEDSEDATAEMPRIYGVIITNTVAGIVSYLSESEMATATTKSYVSGDGLRQIAWLSLSDSNYDVWNSFALAILAIHCRDIIAKLADQGLGYGQEYKKHKERKSEVDPDA